MRILYVEDHERFRSVVIREFLGGHDVLVASNLWEARALLADDLFDVILLDYDLPDGTGVELLQDRERFGVKGPVVAVSSRNDYNARLLAAGACAALSKLKFSQIGEVLENLSKS